MADGHGHAMADAGAASLTLLCPLSFPQPLPNQVAAYQRLELRPCRHGLAVRLLQLHHVDAISPTPTTDPCLI